MKNIKDKKITIRIEQDTYDQFKSLCDEHETTVSILLRELIGTLIENNEKKE